MPRLIWLCSVKLCLVKLSILGLDLFGWVNSWLVISGHGMVFELSYVVLS